MLARGYGYCLCPAHLHFFPHPAAAFFALGAFMAALVASLRQFRQRRQCRGACACATGPSSCRPMGTLPSFHRHLKGTAESTTKADSPAQSKCFEPRQLQTIDDRICSAGLPKPILYIYSTSASFFLACAGSSMRTGFKPISATRPVCNQITCLIGFTFKGMCGALVRQSRLYGVTSPPTGTRVGPPARMDRRAGAVLTGPRASKPDAKAAETTSTANGCRESPQAVAVTRAAEATPLARPKWRRMEALVLRQRVLCRRCWSYPANPPLTFCPQTGQRQVARLAAACHACVSIRWAGSSAAQIARCKRISANCRHMFSTTAMLSKSRRFLAIHLEPKWLRGLYTIQGV